MKNQGMQKISLAVLMLSLLFVWGCSKNDGGTYPKNTVVNVTKISSIKTSNVQIDTLWRNADTIQKHFSTPQTTLELPSPFAKILDSISFNVVIPDSLRFNQDILLPIVFFDESLSILNKTSDSVRINNLVSVQGFSSLQRKNAKEIYNGSINNVLLTGTYQRIYYTADVAVTLVDENKHESTWHGKLKGSRMSTTSTYSKIWD